MNARTIHDHRVRLLIVAGLLIAILIGLAPLQAAQAGTPAKVDPNTIVTNDGQIFNAPVARDTEMAGFAGTNRSPFAPTEDTPEALAGLKPILGPNPGSVIGADGRTKVTSTTTYPYRAIMFLDIVWPSSATGWCTGWLLGKRVAATAGHCVYSSDDGGWATSITGYAGKNGSTNPYGSSTWHRLFSVTGWTGSEDENYDYGAVQFDQTTGSTVGWFGYRWQSASLTGTNVTISGYPADKPSGTQWKMSGKIKLSHSKRLFYSIDTAPGQSGSPVYHNYSSSCNPCSVAIHTTGLYNGYPTDTYNGSTRITQSVFTNLKSWRNWPYP